MTISRAQSYRFKSWGEESFNYGEQCRRKSHRRSRQTPLKSHFLSLYCTALSHHPALRLSAKEAHSVRREPFGGGGGGGGGVRPSDRVRRPRPSASDREERPAVSDFLKGRWLEDPRAGTVLTATRASPDATQGQVPRLAIINEVLVPFPRAKIPDMKRSQTMNEIYADQRQRLI